MYELLEKNRSQKQGPTKGPKLPWHFVLRAPRISLLLAVKDIKQLSYRHSREMGKSERERPSKGTRERMHLLSMIIRGVKPMRGTAVTGLYYLPVVKVRIEAGNAQSRGPRVISVTVIAKGAPNPFWSRGARPFA